MKKMIKKLLSIAVIFSFVGSFVYIAPNVNAATIPEGAIVKTATHHDVFIIKYKNGKQYKRLVLNPQVFESYGHLRWEDILIISQYEMNSFPTSDLVRIYGKTDVYKLIPNGDTGSKHYLTSTSASDLDSIYTINSVDFGNYITGDVVVVEEEEEEAEEIIKYTTKEVNMWDILTGLEIIYIAPLNTEVVVIEEREGWAYVKIGNQEGWIKSEYLSYIRTQVQLLDTNDNDNDGLQNWEEDQRGTDKNNPDTDGDGIMYGEDSHPSGGDRLLVSHFEWEYLGYKYEENFSVPSDWYDYYINKERETERVKYVTYDNFYIQKIADIITKKAKMNGHSKAQVASAFVQSLSYVSDNNIGHDEYYKYPLETLVDQNGDCEDTSFLAAAIIRAMGISCVLVELPGHMAIAIAFGGSPFGYYYEMENNWNYHFMETTGEGWWAGEIPSTYKYVIATLVKIPSGKTERLYPSYK